MVYRKLVQIGQPEINNRRLRNPTPILDRFRGTP